METYNPFLIGTQPDAKAGESSKGYYISGFQDPSVVATYGPKGTLFIRVGSNGGTLYQKQDDGFTTNWVANGSISGLTVNGNAQTAVLNFAGNVVVAPGPLGTVTVTVGGGDITVNGNAGINSLIFSGLGVSVTGPGEITVTAPAVPNGIETLDGYPVGVSGPAAPIGSNILGWYGDKRRSLLVSSAIGTALSAPPIIGNPALAPQVFGMGTNFTYGAQWTLGSSLFFNEGASSSFGANHVSGHSVVLSRGSVVNSSFSFISADALSIGNSTNTTIEKYSRNIIVGRNGTINNTGSFGINNVILSDTSTLNATGLLRQNYINLFESVLNGGGGGGGFSAGTMNSMISLERVGVNLNIRDSLVIARGSASNTAVLTGMQQSVVVGVISDNNNIGTLVRTLFIAQSVTSGVLSNLQNSLIIGETISAPNGFATASPSFYMGTSLTIGSDFQRNFIFGSGHNLGGLNPAISSSFFGVAISSTGSSVSRSITHGENIQLNATNFLANIIVGFDINYQNTSSLQVRNLNILENSVIAKSVEDSILVGQNHQQNPNGVVRGSIISGSNLNYGNGASYIESLFLGRNTNVGTARSSIVSSSDATNSGSYESSFAILRKTDTPVVNNSASLFRSSLIAENFAGFAGAAINGNLESSSIKIQGSILNSVQESIVNARKSTFQGPISQSVVLSREENNNSDVISFGNIDQSFVSSRSSKLSSIRRSFVVGSEFSTSMAGSIISNSFVSSESIQNVNTTSDILDSFLSSPQVLNFAGMMRGVVAGGIINFLSGFRVNVVAVGENLFVDGNNKFIFGQNNNVNRDTNTMFGLYELTAETDNKVFEVDRSGKRKYFGAKREKIRVVALSSYNINANFDSYIIATAGGATVNLPTGEEGLLFTIKFTGIGGGTIQGNSQNIDGSPSISVPQNGSRELIFSGGEWFIMSVYL